MKFEDLVTMVFIGTRVAYTLIDYCVCVFRYEVDPDEEKIEYDWLSEEPDTENEFSVDEGVVGRPKTYGTNNGASNSQASLEVS